ncbi:unnamed protein product [Triticum turgidum subsp. durum]|uniref:Uncharacterized protein n=1 Tax=Triticum turgidum subsp. durum TaxID=4567 RepID=A0A9R1PP07_TRITD|nr:unnamed protein product [Triticum turgidum subsp. durum]
MDELGWKYLPSMRKYFATSVHLATKVSSLLADPSFPISTSNYRKCHSLVIQHVLMVKLTFLFISKIERSGSEGSLGGINALLGCPLHLPSTKNLDESRWGSLSALEKKTVCHSLYFAINWIRELLNAFSTQVAARVDNVSQRVRDETAVKLLKRLRNLILLEILLNTVLKIYPLSLPELRYLGNYSGSTSSSKFNTGKKMGEDNMEGPSSNKRQKGRKDKAASDKLNSDEKLKQSTILDAFKRAGVTITQETKKASSRPLPSGMTSKDVESEANNPGELGHIDLMAAPVQLDMQRFKFRTLHVNCLSLLKYSEFQDSTYPYHESEVLDFNHIIYSY